MRWEPDRAVPPLPYQPPPFGTGVKRGLRNRCPVCGEGHVFDGYLKVTPACSNCGAPMGALRADDAPPYFTILVTGHVLTPFILLVEQAWAPPVWVHMLIWLPLFTLVTLVLLRPVKGAVLGWMMSLGFTGQESHGGAPPPPLRSGGDRDA
jgi:uncharacterized protein (DUF983 family)